MGKFQTLYFDPQSLAIVEQIKRQSKARKRYADVLLAALTLAGRHTLVTWNTADFRDLVPPAQLQNWIDDDIR